MYTYFSDTKFFNERVHRSAYRYGSQTVAGRVDLSVCGHVYRQVETFLDMCMDTGIRADIFYFSYVHVHLGFVRTCEGTRASTCAWACAHQLFGWTRVDMYVRELPQ